MMVVLYFTIGFLTMLTVMFLFKKFNICQGKYDKDMYWTASIASFFVWPITMICTILILPVYCISKGLKKLDAAIDEAVKK